MAHPDYDREIRIIRTAQTTRDKIWSCWTTESGMGSWWTPNCRIEPRAGGAYELYFLMDNPPGTQGGEGNTILTFEPETHLSFSWNAPPTQPETRNQHTVVDLRITDLSPTATEVELLHRGFGIGPPWDVTYAYLQGAWTTVMDRLISHFSPK